MRFKEKFYSTTLASVALIFFIILVSSTALACNEQSTSGYNKQNISDSTPYAYVANNQNQNVSIIDTDTDDVIDSVNNLDYYPSGVAVAKIKKETKVYVAHQYTNHVSEFNKTSPHDVKILPLARGMSDYAFYGEIAASKDGKRAYVTGYSRDESAVFVIDTEKNEFIDTIHLGLNGGNQIAVAQTKIGTKLYMAGPDFRGNFDNVTVVDMANGTINVLHGFTYTSGIAATPDGTNVYVTNNPSEHSGHVMVIDTATDKILNKKIPVGRGPRGIAINPNGKWAYVTNYADNSVTVFDVVSNNYTATVRVGVNPERVAVNPEGTKVYVTNSGLTIKNRIFPYGTVSVIDAIGNQVIDGEIPVGVSPIGVAVSQR